MDPYDIKILSKSAASGVGTNAGVSVTIAAGTAREQYTVLGIQFSGDAAAIVTIESTAGIVWRKRYASAFNGSDRFLPGDLTVPVGLNVLLKISASTSNCEGNIQVAKIVA